jgi:hypothetical protein
MARLRKLSVQSGGLSREFVGAVLSFGDRFGEVVEMRERFAEFAFHRADPIARLDACPFEIVEDTRERTHDEQISGHSAGETRLGFA